MGQRTINFCDQCGKKSKSVWEPTLNIVTITTFNGPGGQAPYQRNETKAQLCDSCVKPFAKISAAWNIRVER
jgi:hypothetical protein